MDVNDDHQNHHHHFNNHTNQNNYHNQENTEGQSLIPIPNDSNQQMDGKKNLHYFDHVQNVSFRNYLNDICTSSLSLDDESDENERNDQSTNKPQNLEMRSLSSLSLLENITDPSTASARRLHSKEKNRILSTSMIRNNQVETYS